MDQPEPYTYTDPSDDTLTISRTNNVASLKAQQGDQATDIHVLPEDVEQVVAAIRTAAGAQQPEPEEQRELRTRLLDYENRITWDTNCGEHARLLDSCRAADERAESAVADRARLRAELEQAGSDAAQNTTPADKILPAPEGPEYTPCACGHIEPEHRDDIEWCYECACTAYAPVDGQARGATGQDTTPAGGEQLREQLARAAYQGYHPRGRWEMRPDEDHEAWRQLADDLMPVVNTAVAAAVAVADEEKLALAADLEQTEDEQEIREQVAEALRQVAYYCEGCGLSESDCRDAHPIQVGMWQHGVVADLSGPVEDIADAVLPVVRAAVAAEYQRAMNAAADFIDNDDVCGCGGCDSCQSRRMAAELRAMATAPKGEQPT